ncbi:MAG: 2-oxo acid dehydrogenase subunit E2 [Clostridia bacterium]|nr:2-oxo acid dehydrogenase subunit E2 [Clostridia bacterium]
MSSKRKHGDRRDGVLLKNIDAMHFIMPVIFPNRCDNEAFVSERIDLTNLSEYLEKKNSDNPEYKYNLFQAIVTAILKTVTLRPKMNRFIANNNLYQRNEISASFVIKKQFTDSSEEGLAFIHAKATDTIDDIHNEIYRQVTYCRTGDNKDSTTEVMEIFNKLPRTLSKAVIKFFCFLERHGKIPASFVKTDPYYSSVILTNLGSIKLHSGYHHLTNWGTTSVFVIVGERKMRPFYDENGNVTMRDSVDLGFTVDERIADGYYFSKTIKLFKDILENPQLLERPLAEEV